MLNLLLKELDLLPHVWVFLVSELLVLRLDVLNNSGGLFQLAGQLSNQVVLCLNLLLSDALTSFLLLPDFDAISQPEILLLHNLDMTFKCLELFLCKVLFLSAFHFQVFDLKMQLLDLILVIRSFISVLIS